MLSKRRVRQGKIRVTFTVPRAEFVERLFIVGEFNNWSVAATPMTQQPDGSWTVALTLDGGRKYAFRYFTDGETWLNDWAADEYVPNEFGSENSVVDLEEFAAPETVPPAAEKKTAARKRTTAKKAPAKPRPASRKSRAKSGTA